jgi:hypothetical protein
MAKQVRYTRRQVEMPEPEQESPLEEELEAIEAKSAKLTIPPQPAPAGEDKPSTLAECEADMEACAARIAWLEAVKERLEVALDPIGWRERERARIKAEVKAELVAEMAELDNGQRRARIAARPANPTGRLSAETVIAALQKVQPASRGEIAKALGVPNTSALGNMLRDLKGQHRIKMTGDRASSRWSVGK